MDTEFPHSLKVLFPGGLLPVKFNLGEHAHDLRYSLNVDPFSAKKPLLVLHHGSTENGQVLAMAKKPERYQNTYKTEIQVTSLTNHTLRQGQLSTTFVTMVDQRRIAHQQHEFSVNMAWGCEKFEWRSTRGNEVQNMFRHPKGFKLVRLGSEGPGEGRGGKRGVRQVGESSDGKEIVAVWATEKSFIPSNMVLGGKPFKFELCGSGKSGQMGEHFSYIALMTALYIWSMDIWNFEVYGITHTGFTGSVARG
ncbi:hypothetical protein F4677DRAFT_440227 [Hypoxylon crocopeplum]|nr:hypothetical protein F4677DRAFT_440227 [Hypoxylon crocopeplum]